MRWNSWPSSWSRDTAKSLQARRCGANSKPWSAIADSLPNPGGCLKSSSVALESLRHREFLCQSAINPFWFRAGHPLANYQSAPTLPPSVDVLIIGAGLTGASAAYHLGAAVRDRGLHVALIDRGDPATEASGRNGGNFELLPENSVGLYGGLARERLKFLLHVYLLCRRKSCAPKANGRRPWS